MSEPAEPADVSGSPTPHVLADRFQALYEECVNTGNAGANWFFWIAGLSLVNTAMAHGGGDRHFIIGLSVTAIVDAIAQQIGKEQPQAASLAMGIAIGFSVCVAIVVILFGWLSRKRLLWVFGIGMGLYLLDGLAYLTMGDYLSAGFHAYALYSMSAGFRAYRHLVRLDATLQEEPGLALAADDVE